jgi:hypothetical protein
VLPPGLGPGGGENNETDNNMQGVL